MHPTKAAAIVALVSTIAVAAYFFILLYQDVVMHKPELAALDSISVGITGKGTVDNEWDNLSEKYLISGGIAVVGLIASLALFGAAKDKS